MTRRAVWLLLLLLLYPVIQPTTRWHVVTKVRHLIPGACPLDGSCLFSLISGLIRRLQPDLACARPVPTASVNPVWDKHRKENDGENSVWDIRGIQQIPFIFLSSLPNLLWGRGVVVVVQDVGYYNFHFRICHPQHSTRSLLFYSLQTHVWYLLNHSGDLLSFFFKRYALSLTLPSHLKFKG